MVGIQNYYISFFVEEITIHSKMVAIALLGVNMTTQENLSKKPSKQFPCFSFHHGEVAKGDNIILLV